MEIARAIGGPDFGGGGVLLGARARQDQKTLIGNDQSTGTPFGVQAVEGQKVIEGEQGEVLFTIIDDDDAALGGDPVLKSDLVGLAYKWGSRFRIRCTDEEVFFRLTGSHERVSTDSTRAELSKC